MSRIVISLSGEGRGHAARTLSLLEMLDGHRVLALVPDKIRQWFERETASFSELQICRLPSLSFQYRSSGKLSYTKSWMVAAPFIAKLSNNLAKLREWVSGFGPELAIADFEPLLPRLASRLSIPLLSLDHQHFLHSIDPAALPRQIRRKVVFLRPSVKLFCPTADRHLVSSFYRYPQRSGTDRYQQIGVLLRKGMGRMPSQVGEHILVYTRRSQAAASWLPTVANASRSVLVYGCGESAKSANIDFRPIDGEQFLVDLSSCKALITTAGNQLVGEALNLGKPVLAIPEKGNFEQQINGYFLAQSGMGQTLAVENVSNKTLRNFLERLAEFRKNIAFYSGSGNACVLKSIHQMLGLATAADAKAHIVSSQKIQQVHQ
ncbi:MAG TPA: hypothetical protein DDW52_06420 [Planctomycetaceae bacterium]|nr:hypothetical protein [Planctomycetaceae bacterium]